MTKSSNNSFPFSIEGDTFVADLILMVSGIKDTKTEKEIKPEHMIHYNKQSIEKYSSEFLEEYNSEKKRKFLNNKIKLKIPNKQETIELTPIELLYVAMPENPNPQQKENIEKVRNILLTGSYKETLESAHNAIANQGSLKRIRNKIQKNMGVNREYSQSTGKFLVEFTKEIQGKIEEKSKARSKANLIKRAINAVKSVKRSYQNKKQRSKNAQISI